ncbi:hypothetical protein HAX54_001583, partial [Datura stramonium]|nr:hypothetical protein [Datura stramonium]
LGAIRGFRSSVSIGGLSSGRDNCCLPYNFYSKLEQQVKDIYIEYNPKQKGKLLSDTVVNPKGHEGTRNAHCMAIVTKNGKIMQHVVDEPYDVGVDEDDR